MSFLKNIDYQPVVDCLVKLGKQLDKPSYRFLKGEVIALALEKATDGRLKYIDDEGYDSIDLETDTKYEFKSTSNMFSFKENKITGRVSLSNNNKSTFVQTFDYLLCIQSNPTKFAIAQLTWNECNKNYNKIKEGQINLNYGLPVTDWICKESTEVCNFQPMKLEVRKLLESIL
jgi:hypothetical protein